MGSDSEESYDPGEPPVTTEPKKKADEEMYDLGVFDEDPEELQKRAETTIMELARQFDPRKGKIVDSEEVKRWNRIEKANLQ